MPRIPFNDNKAPIEIAELLAKSKKDIDFLEKKWKVAVSKAVSNTMPDPYTAILIGAVKRKEHRTIRDIGGETLRRDLKSLKIICRKVNKTVKSAVNKDLNPFFRQCNGGVFGRLKSVGGEFKVIEEKTRRAWKIFQEIQKLIQTCCQYEEDYLPQRGDDSLFLRWRRSVDLHSNTKVQSYNTRRLNILGGSVALDSSNLAKALVSSLHHACDRATALGAGVSLISHSYFELEGPREHFLDLKGRCRTLEKDCNAELLSFADFEEALNISKGLATGLVANYCNTIREIKDKKRFKRNEISSELEDTRVEEVWGRELGHASS